MGNFVAYDLADDLRAVRTLGVAFCALNARYHFWRLRIDP